MDMLKGINHNYIYILAFVVAFLLTSFLTPYAKKVAVKVGAIDHPKEIGVHKIAMPLAGGMAIVASFIITALIFVPVMDGFVSKEFIGIMIGGLLISLLGLMDDIYKLSPRLRIFFQILAALIVVFTGTRIEWLTWPWSSSGLIALKTFGNFMTIFWIVGLINAVNFIDGLDGLAAGIASIASLSFMVISFIFGPPVGVILAAILAGSCSGFLPHNFNPAKIFMGDTGSTFLGFMLAVLSIQGLTKSYTVIAVMVGGIVLGLPIFDTSFAIVRRIANKQSITQGDRRHLHHRLVDKGISHKRAVLTMYGVSGAFGIAGILFAMSDFLLAGMIIAVILMVWVGDIIYSTYREKHLLKK